MKTINGHKPQWVQKIEPKEGELVSFKNQDNGKWHQAICQMHKGRLVLLRETEQRRMRLPLDTPAIKAVVAFKAACSVGTKECRGLPKNIQPGMLLWRVFHPVYDAPEGMAYVRLEDGASAPAFLVPKIAIGR